MTVFFVSIRERVTDAEQLQKYGEGVPATLEGHDVQHLAVYGAIDTLEGDPVDGVVILKFGSRAEARAWYDSPTYQSVAKHRHAGGEYRVFIVDGLDAGGTP